MTACTEWPGNGRLPSSVLQKDQQDIHFEFYLSASDALPVANSLLALALLAELVQHNGHTPGRDTHVRKCSSSQ